MKGLTQGSAELTSSILDNGRRTRADGILGQRKTIVRVDYDDVIDLAGLCLIELVTIGPKEATQLLAQNYGLNRNIRPRSVELRALDMISERWVFNGDALRFTSDGTLVDGQHRLLAVVESETEQDFLVVRLRGNPKDIYATIDTGEARTHADVAKAHGYARHSQLSSVANCVWRLEKHSAGISTGSMKAMPKTVLGQFIDDRPGLHATAEFVARCNKGIKGLARGGAVGAAHFFWSKVDEKRAGDLLWRIADDDRDVRGKGDPAHVLRKKLDRMKGSRFSYSNDELFYLLQKAWDIDVEGENASAHSFQVPKIAPVPFLAGMELSIGAIIDSIGLTHVKLAKRLGVGATSISGWYHSKAKPPASITKRLLKLRATALQDQKPARHA